MKRLPVLISHLFVFGSLILTTPALAVSIPPESYAAFYTTTDKGITTQTTEFNWDQWHGNDRPWLYIKFFNPSPDEKISQSTVTTWSWNDFTITPDASDIIEHSSDKNEMWLKFSKAKWEGITENREGWWTLSALSFLTLKGKGSDPDTNKLFFGETKFRLNAVPEPISTVLFLTGGTLMGTRLLRKRQA